MQHGVATNLIFNFSIVDSAWESWVDQLLTLLSYLLHFYIQFSCCFSWANFFDSAMGISNEKNSIKNHQLVRTFWKIWMHFVEATAWFHSVWFLVKNKTVTLINDHLSCSLLSLLSFSSSLDVLLSSGWSQLLHLRRQRNRRQRINHVAVNYS